jgi:sugar O-acyltransferase (sialic acid O-acetyltransferase NeuD family)
MSEKKMIIVGASDFGREIMYAALEDINNTEDSFWKTVAFVDEDENKIGTTIDNIDVISFVQAIRIIDDNTYFILGVGDAIARENLNQKLLNNIPEAQFATIIHQSVIIMPSTTIENGVFIAPNTTIAIGCRIKPHVVVNQNVSVGHDCIIEDFSVISPGSILSGRTKIGKATFMGSGAITYPGVQIGDYCAVSACTVVARNLKDGNKQILKPNTMIIPSE